MNEEWKDILGQPVGIVDCDGNLLYSFGSLREAESKIGVSRFGITAACNGIQQSAGDTSGVSCVMGSIIS